MWLMGCMDYNFILSSVEFDFIYHGLAMERQSKRKVIENMLQVL